MPANLDECHGRFGRPFGSRATAQRQPLRKVIASARSSDVIRMRELLLEHGASESAFERQRWEERQRADANDAAWLKNFHRSEQSATDRLCLCPYPRLYSYFCDAEQGRP